MEWSWFGQAQLSKGQATQLKVIKASLELFSHSGFQSVTLQEIAKKSGTSHPLIIKHFKSKENLLVAVRKYVSFCNHQWVDSRINDTMNGKERIFTFLYENLNWGYQNPEQAKMVLLTYYYSSLNSPETSSGSAAFEMGVHRLYKHSLQAQREKLISVKVDLMRFTEITHEYAVGLFIRMIATRKATPKRLPKVYRDKLLYFLESQM